MHICQYLHKAIKHAVFWNIFDNYHPHTHHIIHSSFIMPTGSHIQIYSEVQLYNKLYLYTIGLHTDKHIMQKHIKGPYSEILQKHKNNTTQEEKPIKKIKIKLDSVQNRTTQHL